MSRRTKRTTSILLGLLACLALATPVAAQEDEPVPQRFIDISEGLQIEGELMRPSGDLFVGREGAEFNPLFEARRSFVDEIIQSAEELPHQ